LKIRIAGIAVFILLGVFLGTVQPFSPGLNLQGHLVLVSVLVALGFWIFGTGWLPLTVGTISMLLLLLVAGVKLPIVFNGFTSRATWILIPALFFGFALTKTGLGKRLAYWVIRSFRPSYLSFAISWVIIGVVLSMLTPSITVRFAIMVPVAAAMVEICQVGYGSKGASFIMLSAWSMALIPGTGWLTGSLWGPTSIGFFSAVPGLENVITFDSWMKVLLVPTALLTIFFILGLYKFLRPTEKLNMGANVFKDQYRALGPMSSREKATLIILILTFILLVTAQYTGLPDAAICMGAFILLALAGIIGPRDIGPAISWDMVLFMGAIIGMGTVFQETGVTAFLIKSFAPAISSITINLWILIFVALAVLFLWRFFEVAQLMPTIPFLLPFLPTLTTNYNIHPLVLYLPMLMAGNCFFMAYQQPFVMVGEFLAGKAVWTPQHLRQAGTIYFLACILTLALSIPYWMATGIIK
jgi:anion transporter